MKFETEAGTDIAMIGIWDADVPVGELRKIPYKRLMEELSKDGHDGKILRVDTGADGGYPICVVSTEEEFGAFRLDAYAEIQHDFFLYSQSGNFIAGGLEDYRNGTPQLTSENDRFRLEPGGFRVRVYTHDEDEDQIAKQVADEVGEDDLRHYQERKSGCGIAMAAIAFGMVGGYFWSWWVLLPAILLAARVVSYFSKLNSSDERVQRVERAFREYDNNHPALIFHFESVSEIGESCGFFHLDEVLNQQG